MPEGEFHTILEAARLSPSSFGFEPWRLDVGIRENECPSLRSKWRGEAGENMAAIRQMVVNTLNGETSFKAGIKRKQKRTIRNNTHLSQVLAGLGGVILPCAECLQQFHTGCRTTPPAFL
ncbi:hypothetical protein [Oceanisphaera sp. KMM 10153]|uniref:hypothetical protein n=1 Tax=Oceanisphaera submarina TaxID=3390193 RepID=UPI0039769D6A